MNIDLKKYGLKEVKFSELADGDEFNKVSDFGLSHPPEFYRRKLAKDNVVYVDGTSMAMPETVELYLKKNPIVFVKA